MSTSMRDPFPIEKFENDCSFNGRKQESKAPFSLPSHLAQTEDPWNRLAHDGTLSSIRHEANQSDPLAPVDNLDFKLKTLYNQHSNLFKDRHQIMWQPETLYPDGCGRILKNRYRPPEAEQPPLNHPLRICNAGRKDSPCSVKGGIPSHHSQETNKGFSRKPDGGVFTS